MPNLRWLKRDGAILPSGSWNPGKEVVLKSDGFVVPPGSFAIYRQPAVLMRAIRERRGRPGRILLDTLPATVDRDGSATSPSWTLPTPGHRLKWRVVFEDEQLHTSAVQHISRLGIITPSIGVSTRYLPIGVDAKVQVGIIASVDPLVEVDVMTPWAEPSWNLYELLDELVRDGLEEGEDPEPVRDDLLSLLSGYLPSTSPPEWELSVSTGTVNRTEREFSEGGVRLDLMEQGRAEVHVNLHAPTPGAIAFALQMRAIGDNPERPHDMERASCASDLILVDVPEDPERAELRIGDWEVGSTWWP